MKLETNQYQFARHNQITVNVDIFAHQALGGIFAWFKFRAYTIKFYLFYYDYNFHSHQIFAHLYPCAKCAKIWTARKFLRLQYVLSLLLHPPPTGPIVGYGTGGT